MARLLDTNIIRDVCSYKYNYKININTKGTGMNTHANTKILKVYLKVLNIDCNDHLIACFTVE